FEARADRLRRHATGLAAAKLGRTVAVSRRRASFGQDSNESGRRYQRQSTGAKAQSAIVNVPTTVPLSATKSSASPSGRRAASSASASAAWSASSQRPLQSPAAPISPTRSAGKSPPRIWVLQASSAQSTRARATGSSGYRSVRR